MTRTSNQALTYFDKSRIISNLIDRKMKEATDLTQELLNDILDGMDTYLFNPGEWDKATEAISEALEDVCREQREACRKRHVERFGFTHCADVILETPLVTTKTDK